MNCDFGKPSALQMFASARTSRYLDLAKEWFWTQPMSHSFLSRYLWMAAVNFTLDIIKSEGWHFKCDKKLANMSNLSSTWTRDKRLDRSVCGGGHKNECNGCSCKKRTSAAFQSFSLRRRRETNRVGEEMQDNSVSSFWVCALMFSSFLIMYLNWHFQSVRFHQAAFTGDNRSDSIVS